MAMKPEARIKRALKDMLKSEFPQVWTYWPVSNGMGVHGIPDLIMCAGGKFIGVEVKAQGKKVTLLQAHQLQQIERAAGTSLVLSGDTAVDTLRAFLSCMHLPRTPDIQSHFPPGDLFPYTQAAKMLATKIDTAIIDELACRSSADE